MSKTARMRIAYGGIFFCFLYYAVIAAFFVFGTDVAVILWEISIILSGPVMFLILLSIFDYTDESRKVWKTVSVVFMTLVIALTWATHFVHLTVVMPLEASGVNVPDYFKFAQWPSVIMAIEYIAWGGGMGLAFIFCAVSLSSKYAGIKKVKYTTLISGCLCLLGLFGVAFVSDLLWLFAPAGFAVGTPLICIQMISLSKNTI